jgi:pilus assembly protein Flp/PilA
MRNIMKARREDGASAVEYGLLVAAIAALIVVVVFVLGGIIQKVFKHTCDTIASNAGSAVTSKKTCKTS